MNTKIQYFKKQLDAKSFKIRNNDLFHFIQQYFFFDFSIPLGNEKINIINENIKESKIIIIDRFNDAKTSFSCFIIGLRKTIIFIPEKSMNFVDNLISKKPDLEIFILPNAKNTFKLNSKVSKIETNCGNIFLDEIFSFKEHFKVLESNNRLIISFISIIQPCISGYLIKESYKKISMNRIDKFLSNFEKQPTVENITEENYIKLRTIGSSMTSIVYLVYYIQKEEIFALKYYIECDIESEKLSNREIENYSHLDFPFIPKFIGTNKNKKFILFEFVNGKTLSNIENLHLSDDDKISIIFDLMLTIEYLHRNNFIYRDLKPNNVMIDQNKTAVLIDFDRLISKESKNIKKSILFSEYAAPEVFSSYISNKCDIYSLGKLINYIKIGNQLTIIKNCLNTDPSKRPDISQLILEFYINYRSRIKNIPFFETNEYYFTSPFKNEIMKNIQDTYFKIGLVFFNNKFLLRYINKSIQYFTSIAETNDIDALFALSNIYFENKFIKRDINKSIHYLSLLSDLNCERAQANLGTIYFQGKYISRDISKAIYYYKLAANQNEINSQFNLGLMYYDEKYVPCDIDQSIHYFKLAADQNDQYAQYYLGKIYFEKYFPKDIMKAIHYFKLAAAQNHLKSQIMLGMIYLFGKNVSHDITKSLYYFSLAANQNNPYAQYILGLLYSNDDYISCDIKKSIHYLMLASDQNYTSAQRKLGLIYYDNKYISCDIKKSIHYFTLAANQKDLLSLVYLGWIYYKGYYVSADINKSIHYFTLAANQNASFPQLCLGIIYYENMRIPVDINKSIHYFSLAANQNVSMAQFYLGLIYYDNLYVPIDINKSIHYFSLAAKQNHPKALFYLGLIYSDEKNASIDINKSINYFSLAAKQNDSMAQFYLGLIFYDSLHVPIDINKSIYYFKLSANQNNSMAQCYLGLIYSDEKNASIDISKSIHYLMLSANQNNSIAQFHLGFIYLLGKNVPFDINKSIYYLTLSANQKNSMAQCYLGWIYYYEKVNPTDINKAIYYLTLAANQDEPAAQYIIGSDYFINKKLINNLYKSIDMLLRSAKNNYLPAIFTLGYLYHEGKYLERDIQKCLKFYKEASSFNFQYAKNNLGIIYKNGFKDEIPKNIKASKIYFKEAIKQKNDPISMYNLSHIYIYEKGTNKSICKAIKLLIQSYIKNFRPSLEMLCIILMKKYKSSIVDVQNEIKIYIKNTNEIINTIFDQYLDIPMILEVKYQNYKNIDYLYNQLFYEFPSNQLFNPEKKLNYTKMTNQRNIDIEFYKGFDIK